MASNESSCRYSVKVLYLPTTISDNELAQTFDLPESRIRIPKSKKNTSNYVWVNGFTCEKDANDFANLWSNSNKFGNKKIKCHVRAANCDSKNRCCPSNSSDLVSSPILSDADSDTQNSICRRVSSCSSLSSISIEMKHCPDGMACPNSQCEFTHPDGWDPCIYGIECRQYECMCNHPDKRTLKCFDGENCKISTCKFLHPNTRPNACMFRARCNKWDCKKTHPHSRRRLCPDEENCTNLTCLCLHPAERRKLLCSVGADCHDLSCQLNHPPERPPPCDQPTTCLNLNCTYIHASDWNPSKLDVERSDNNENKSQRTTKILKSLEQRMKDREKAQLPIFDYRTEFCNRLRSEHILVVTAETGSGKSTQLPQYAAEQFGSLVVCTQPRVVAALSLAHRVAEEYDGTSVGESVGYKTGHANQVDGNHIMFMTDAALIHKSQWDPKLKDISVLIIDEAHERSLNTDIVLGIAKILLAERPNDFYVVIASATIDPTRFLRYFDRQTSLPLDVEGRVFSVTMINKPPPSNCSDQTLIEKHIIPSIVEFYPNHEGHVLVFLPGQGEIEKALRIFQSYIPKNCIALPLYGSQSREDQEKVIKFNEKNKRMVVFCTNVAETSLTIPNVRLVVDSGWAKEARYDTKRRLTVIETVRISRSSADQRKGRAGRTAIGHCVRLYADKELQRLNIEPEILRSSLDLVLLQLIRLNFDPKTFQFMDQPPLDVIHNSIDLLTRLKCIDNQKITQRGELFTELGLDPRFSAFIIDIYGEYQSLLELAVGIVSILSAPGTLFFMGGSTQEAKDDAKMRIASRAQNYQSDLFHLYSVYQEWKNVSRKQMNGKCSQCSKQFKRCICRIKHSNENGLNNKILQNINSTSVSIMKKIQDTSWLKPGDEFPENQMDIISKHLSQFFPEQCGYLLVSQLPIEGVRLISTDVRANITNTSVFMQKLHTDSNNELYQHFIAMTITQLPSGRYIIEKLHPIPRSLASVETSIRKLHVVENIGSLVFHRMRGKLNTYRSEQWAKWAVYQYDRLHCCCIVWGCETEKTQIIQVVQQTYVEVLNELYANSVQRECGPIKATFQSGLHCTHINKMTNTLRLDLKNVPVVKSNELMIWLKKKIGIDRNHIKYHKFLDRNKNLCLFFKDDDAYRRAIDKTPIYYLNQQENEFGFRRDNEKDSWGRQLTIETPHNITIKNIIEKYGVHIITNCIQLNKQTGKQRVEASFKLNNLPTHYDETRLRDCLQENNGPQPSEVSVRFSKNNLTALAIVTFNDVIQCNKAAAIYGQTLCQNIFPIAVQGTRDSKTKFIRTSIENKKVNIPKNRFLITVINREEASRIYSSQAGFNMNLAWTTSSPDMSTEWKIDGSASVTVLRTNLYPNCQQIANHICSTHSIKVIDKSFADDTKRYTFIHGSPQTTSLAASKFTKYFTSMIIQLNTERQKQLFNELEEIGELKNWADDLTLSIEKNESNTKIEIRGAQIAQGEFMRRIADYSDEFNQRFREYELNSTLTAFFGSQQAASSKLQEIHSRWSVELCSISFNSKTSTIYIFGKPNVKLEDLNACENEVIQLLNELTATIHDDENEEEEEGDEDNNVITQQDRCCVFCKQKSSISTNLFRICGHAYCRCAAQYLSTSINFPLQCKDCQTKIHIRDIELIFNNNEQLFMRLLKHSIQTYLKGNAHDDDRVFCPNHECNGLIKSNLGYQSCLICGQNVCGKCQVVNDYSHTNQSCEQMSQAKQRCGFLSDIFKAAKKFTRDNWPVNDEMSPISRIDENPYLEKHYKSLKRFYQGVKMLGQFLPPDLSKGFFAYHGTAPQAIVPICEHGFDPKRRSGQVYGRGEYFGVTAAVSHGYTKKQGSQIGIHQMIIAFILRCPQLRTQENFCYVVDNPVNWEYAFNLPVLIVTYGRAARMPPSPFPISIPVFVDEDDKYTHTPSTIPRSPSPTLPRFLPSTVPRSPSPTCPCFLPSAVPHFPPSRYAPVQSDWVPVGLVPHFPPSAVPRFPLPTTVPRSPSPTCPRFLPSAVPHFPPSAVPGSLPSTVPHFPPSAVPRFPLPTTATTTTSTTNNNNSKASCWHAPFHWYWDQDKDQFQPYNDSDNLVLESSYQQWKLQRGPATITIQIDGTKEIYQIDYKNNQQMNTKTFYSRKIERRLLEKTTEKKKWFYQDNHANWIQYNASIENLIQEAFNSYRFKQGPSTRDIPNGQLNFLTGQEINKSTYTTKNIKYEQGCQEPVKPNEVVKFFRNIGEAFSNIFKSKK